MARFSRLKVLNTIIAGGLVPVFYNNDANIVIEIAKACVNGGLNVLEFTNRGDRAFKTFLELREYCDKEKKDLILGVGSIVDDCTAALYINSGANFIVGPVLNIEVAKLCNRRKVPYFPGCDTLTEISLAEEYGVEICKIFPAQEIGGHSFVKNILGPLPWSFLMPTGGVDPTKESLEKWFKSGVVCVAMGSKLITNDSIEKKDFESISRKISEVLKIIKEIRGIVYVEK